MPERFEELRVDKLHCASCAVELERSLTKVDGVRDAQVLFGAGKVQVRYDESLLDRDTLAQRLGRLGHQVVHPQAPQEPWWRDRPTLFTAISGAWLLIGLIVNFFTADPLWSRVGWWELRASSLFYLAAVGFGGVYVLRSGVRAALERRLGIDALMTVAIVGAVGIGQLVEAASLAFLYALAERLEDYAVDRARHSLRELLKLVPNEATACREGKERVLPVEEVRVGETVVVRPGEKVPLDGTVRAGTSSVNQAPITGESVPIEKAPGDPVYAGSLNEEGLLELEVTAPAQDTTLARIIHLVERAEAQKAPTEQFVETFGRYYTPGVVGLAVLVALVPPLAFQAPFVPWFLRGITLLVISCPCALLISTPVSVVSAITAAARHGVLIKGGAYLEALGQVRALALDKTGTLTTGRLEVTDVVPQGGARPEEVLRLAASLEANSLHPIAQAIGRAAQEVELAAVTDFRSLTAQGVEGTVQGARYRVGKPRLFPQRSPEVLERFRREAKTVVGVGSEGETLGWIALADQIRPEAQATVRALRELGLELVMITGDHEATAQAVAARLGLDHHHAGVLPKDKLEEVHKLRERYGSVAMVGDGVNDAPALAAATVGIAMGAIGSDTALETADVALLGDDLSKLPYLIRLSRRARRGIQQNVTASLLIKFGLAAGVFPGWVTLVLAVLVGDMGATLAVTGNALRLAWLKPMALKTPPGPAGKLAG